MQFLSNRKSTFCKQTVRNLIKRRILPRLIRILHCLPMSHKKDVRLIWANLLLESSCLSYSVRGHRLKIQNFICTISIEDCFLHDKVQTWTICYLLQFLVRVHPHAGVDKQPSLICILAIFFRLLFMSVAYI